MIVTRSRTPATAPEAVRRLLGDSRSLSRWWPRAERVLHAVKDRCDPVGIMKPGRLL